jgi:hypothetical protein
MYKDFFEGSRTAKSGFSNERDIAEKFNNWKNDSDAKLWLKVMNYKLSEIEKVEAVILHGCKTDVQVQVTIYMKKAISVENLSVKLASNPTGFNQVDKRWVDKYVAMWKIPPKIAKALKLFTGEIRPTKKGLRDPRRMFLTEMDEPMRKSIVEFFAKNKILVVTDILKGSDRFAADWMMVALRKPNNTTEWALKSINKVLNIFGGGKVSVTPQGSLRIGKIGMQRKGGDAGRPTANMLQFKINPVELFNA